jgi:hypothetical protein
VVSNVTSVARGALLDLAWSWHDRRSRPAGLAEWSERIGSWRLPKALVGLV